MRACAALSSASAAYLSGGGASTDAAQNYTRRMLSASSAHVEEAWKKCDFHSAARQPPPHNRPTWDLTSVLYALYPDAGYFDTSTPGTVKVLDNGETEFHPHDSGSHSYLMMSDGQRIRVQEALVQLSSQPPDR